MDDDKYTSLQHINLSGRGNQLNLSAKRASGTIKVSFEEHRVERGESRAFVAYSIRVHNILFDYTIVKRFSDFEALYARLRALFPRLLLPQLPEKLIFSNFDERKISERKGKLERFLNEVIALLVREGALEQLFEFLELSSHNMHSLLDLNNSNFLITDKCTLEYIKLIYEKDKLERNLRNLREVLARQKVSAQTAELMLKGSDSFVGLFVVAFSHHKYFDAYLYEKPDLSARKPQSKSFSLEHHQSVAHAQQPRSAGNVHHACMVVSAFILDLLDPSKSSNAKVFRDVFKDAGAAIFSGAEFRHHLCAKGSTMCKRNCYEILKIYKELSNNLDEFFLFSEVDEYRKFATWYAKQARALRKEPLFEDAEAAFPRVDDILFNNEICEDFIFTLMDVFMDKRNLNLLSLQEDKNIATLSFTIRGTRRDAFVKSLLDFAWLENVLKVVDNSMVESDLMYVDNAQLLCMRTYFLAKGRGDARVHYAMSKFYAVSRGERCIIVVAPQDPSAYSREQLSVLYDAEGAPQSEYVPQANDFGFFVDIEPYESDAELARVSLLVNYMFLDKKNDSAKKRFEHFKKSIVAIKNNADAMFS